MVARCRRADRSDCGTTATRIFDVHLAVVGRVSDRHDHQPPHRPWPASPATSGATPCCWRRRRRSAEPSRRSPFRSAGSPASTCWAPTSRWRRCRSVASTSALRSGPFRRRCSCAGSAGGRASCPAPRSAILGGIVAGLSVSGRLFVGFVRRPGDRRLRRRLRPAVPFRRRRPGSAGLPRPRDLLGAGRRRRRGRHRAADGRSTPATCSPRSRSPAASSR